jgi:hypothetical protein
VLVGGRGGYTGSTLRILALLLLLVGCSPSTGVTIHNGTSGSVELNGLPDGKVVIDAGSLHRAGNITKPLTLAAKSTTGPDTFTTQLALPSPGGEAVWAIGGKACFIDGDFTEYYEAPTEVPVKATVVARIEAGTETWVSDHAIHAGPGERLPSGSKGSVRALVHVPCKATVSDPVARSWLEMILPDIEPKP